MKSLRVGLCFDAGALTRKGFSKFFRSHDVVLFPELVDGGYAALYEGAAPLRLYDPFVERFRKASKTFSLTCIAGSIHLLSKNSHSTDSTLVFTRGRLVHRYDKVHLFKPTLDHRYFSRGTSVQTFTLPCGALRLKAGVVICYDLRFPELIRKLAVQGMQVLFVPARWPRIRDDAWQTLLKARAIENQIFVIGCNALGREGGYSYAFDPLGSMIFSNRKSPKASVGMCRLNLRRLEEARRLHQNIKDAILLRGKRL
jgi:predicted amidohydrolase